MKRVKRISAWLAGAAVLAVAAMAALAWLVPLPERLGETGSRVVLYSDGSPMLVSLSSDDKWRIPAGLDDVDPDYVAALIAYEDERFRYHPGVDPVAAVRAAGQNIAAGRVVSGASTITMQLVRILEPRPRTMKSKVVESFLALQLETRMTKDEILGLYLQYAPYGGNIEGIEAASLAFFGHGAKNLTPYEICYLLSVPQAPSSRYPSPETAAEMKPVTDRIARRLLADGVFNGEQAEAAEKGSAPARVLPFPRDALHLSQWLLKRSGEMRVRSTVRRDHQALVENAFQSRRLEYRAQGIHNGCGVVVDVETGAVTAAVGNFDFWDEDHGGQVVGFLAPRSPGSAMKPFIYALALDRGLALPDYLVADVPRRYGAYEPINFDREYRGMVKLEDALSQSLNIPFIDLLKEVGVPEYLRFLDAGGLSTINHEPGHYGLSLAVGAMDERPAEMANLYATLARGGEHRDLRWTMDEPEGESRRLLSEGSCFLTRRALRRRDRPDFPMKSRALKVPRNVFWKTGTSSRHKDAWAAGGTRDFVAAVWFGNFEGPGNHALVGSDISGPPLFDIMEALDRADSRLRVAEARPDDLIEISICAWSGRPAGPDCPHVKKALALRGAVPAGGCPFHQSHLVDKDTGLRLTPLCARGRETEERVFLSMPSALRRWIGDQGLDINSPPPFHPDCKRVSMDGGPRISYPREDMVFFLTKGLRPDDQEIKLEADAASEAGDLFWFVDGAYLGQAPAHGRVWYEPSPGRHELAVQDASGRGHSISIKVLEPDRPL